MNTVALIVGLLIVAVAAADACNAVVSTRIHVHWDWPSDLFDSLRWRVIRGVTPTPAARIGGDAGPPTAGEDRP